VWPWVQNPPKLKGGWKQIFMHPAVLMVLGDILTTVGCSAPGSLRLCHVYLNCFIVPGGAKQTGE